MTPKLTETELRELLEAPEIGVLCTVDAEGRPEGSPIWFEASAGKIFVLVEKTSKKARNIRANPHVSLTVDTRVPPYRGAVLHGTVRELPADDGVRRRTAIRYLGEEGGQAYLDMTAEGVAGTSLLEMTITGRFTWDYSKGF